MIEKRKHRRTPCRKQTTTIVTSPSGRVVGSLIDISSGGARFNYVDLGRHPDTDTDLKITFQTENEKREFSCHLVWQRTSEPVSVFNVVQMREGGVFFDKPVVESAVSC